MRRFAKFGAIALSIVMAFTLAGCSNKAANTSAPAAVKEIEKGAEGYYVNTKYLQDNLSKVTVVDARATDAYNAGHVPGAINITWQMLSNMEVKQGEKGWGVVLGKDELAAKIGSFGIDGTKQIVVYNDPTGLGEEGRVAWMLKIAGIKDVKMLNGGITAWKAVNGTMSKDTAAIAPVQFKIEKYDDSMMATTDYVRENLKTAKLVDTRSIEEYNAATNHGENYKGAKALGRIPGALSLPYSNLYNVDGTIKSIADLTAEFEKLGLKKTDKIVTYCTVGIRSGFTAEIMKMCGYENVKNYNGSFSEWAGLGNEYDSTKK